MAPPPLTDSSRRSFRPYDLLENVRIYRLAQNLLAPEADRMLSAHIRRILKQIPSGPRLLDIGCGPSSWLQQIPLEPIGCDLSLEYIRAFCRKGGRGFVGSCTSLPFKSASFSSVWSLGLLHHLPDDSVGATVEEMMRVCEPGGSVVIFDGVLPRHFLKNAFVWLLRKFDRGRHMRSQESLEELLKRKDGRWKCERVSYSRFGHEGVFWISCKAGTER